MNYSKVKEFLAKNECVVKVQQIEASKIEVLFPEHLGKDLKFDYKIKEFDDLGFVFMNQELWSLPRYTLFNMIEGHIFYTMKSYGLHRSLIVYCDADGNEVDSLLNLFDMSFLTDKPEEYNKFLILNKLLKAEKNAENLKLAQYNKIDIGYKICQSFYGDA